MPYRGRGRGGARRDYNTARASLPADWVIPSLKPGDTLYGGLLCRRGKVALVQNRAEMTEDQECAAIIIERDVLPRHWMRQMNRFHSPSIVLAVTDGGRPEQGVLTEDEKHERFGQDACFVEFVSTRWWASYEWRGWRSCYSDDDEVCLPSPIKLLSNWLRANPPKQEDSIQMHAIHEVLASRTTPSERQTELLDSLRVEPNSDQILTQEVPEGWVEEDEDQEY